MDRSSAFMAYEALTMYRYRRTYAIFGSPADAIFFLRGPWKTLSLPLLTSSYFAVPAEDLSYILTVSCGSTSLPASTTS